MTVRGYLVRALLTLLLAFTVSITSVAPASAAIENLRKYAGIVVDAKSGKVLYEEQADSRRYPASVAKVMTLYIVFQELQAGNLTLNTKMRVSKHAAAAVPTKLGLKAGSEITVENAIKALVTLSANDIARVIAEHISGSESKFAERMTATAKALGMSHTTYRNASGLPDGGQVTTVRDQAILGIAVYQHFPKYYSYFQTKSFSYGKRTYGNHNNVLGYMGAVDGIKTGYINAAGSNLLTAARKDGRHIVVVAFGFNKAAQRDAKVRDLVGKYLTKGRRGDYLLTAQIPVPGRQGNAPVMVAQSAQPVFVTPMPLPSFRVAALQAASNLPAAQAAPAPLQQAVAAPVAAASAPTQPADLGLDSAVQAANRLGGAPQPAERPDVIGAWISETFSLGAPPAALGETAPSAPLLPPVGIGAEGQPVDLMTSGSISRPQAAATTAQAKTAETSPAPGPATGGWVVQIGASPSQNGAADLLNDASTQVSMLSDYRAYTERFEKNGQTFFRARFTGFGDREDAARMCNELKKAKMSCLALQS